MLRSITALIVAAGCLAGTAHAAPSKLYEQKRVTGIWYDMYADKAATVSYPLAGWTSNSGSYFTPPFTGDLAKETAITKYYPFWAANYSPSYKPIDNLYDNRIRLGGDLSSYLSNVSGVSVTPFNTYYGTDAVPPRKLMWPGWSDDYHTTADINISGQNVPGSPNEIDTDHGVTVAIRDFAWSDYDNSLLRPGLSAPNPTFSACSLGDASACAKLKCRFRLFIKNNTGDVVNDTLFAAWKYGHTGTGAKTMHSYANDVGNVTFFPGLKVNVSWPGLSGYNFEYTTIHNLKPGEAIDVWFADSGSRCFNYDIENLSGNVIDEAKAPKISLTIPPCTIVPLYLDEVEISSSSGGCGGADRWDPSAAGGKGRCMRKSSLISTRDIIANHTSGNQSYILPSSTAASSMKIWHACIPNDTFKKNDRSCNDGVDRTKLTDAYRYSTEECQFDLKAAYAAGYIYRIDLPPNVVYTAGNLSSTPSSFLGVPSSCTGEIQNCLSDCASSAYKGGLCKSTANLGATNQSTDWSNPLALIFRDNCGGHFNGTCLLVNLQPSNSYNNNSYIMPDPLYKALGIGRLYDDAVKVMIGNYGNTAAVQAALTQGNWTGLPSYETNGEGNRSTSCFRLYCSYGCNAHLANPSLGCLSFTSIAREIGYLLCNAAGECRPVSQDSCVGAPLKMPFTFSTYDSTGAVTNMTVSFGEDAYLLDSAPRCENMMMASYAALLPMGIYRGVVSEMGATYDSFFSTVSPSIGETFNCTVGRSQYANNMAARDRDDHRCYPDYTRWTGVAGVHTPVNSRLIRMYTIKDMKEIFGLSEW